MAKIREPGTRPEQKNTADEQRQSITAEPTRNDTRFKAGNPGGPGRPAGSRDKLTQAFLRDLQAIWDEGGIEMLRRLEKTDPRSVVAACVALVPKSVEVDSTRRVYRMRETPLTPDEWQAKHSGGVPIPKQSETAH